MWFKPSRATSYTLSTRLPRRRSGLTRRLKGSKTRPLQARLLSPRGEGSTREEVKMEEARHNGRGQSNNSSNDIKCCSLKSPPRDLAEDSVKGRSRADFWLVTLAPFVSHVACPGISRLIVLRSNHLSQLMGYWDRNKSTSSTWIVVIVSNVASNPSLEVYG
jgi:hypothetical protein